MAITADELKAYLTGATSDGGAQSDPNLSLGNYRSSTEITSGVDNNVFDDVSGTEASSGDTEYRCICFKNTNPSLALQNAKVYLGDADIGTGNAVSFAVERPASANPTNGNAQSVADESTAPTVNATNHNGTGSGVSDWSTATSYAAGVPVSQGSYGAALGVGEIIFVWIKRVIGPEASAASGVNFSIKLEGDTAA